MKEDIENALSYLNDGKIILYPTDTIWGLGCDATNESAVKKIFEIKQRADRKSMIILLDSINKIYSYSDSVPDIALDIIEISEKPTTVVFSKAKNIADNLIAEDGSIGIRIVNHLFCNELLRRFKKPIVSTSANISGTKAPSNFSEIQEEIKKSVDYIVKYNQNNTEIKKSSSIIKIGEGGLLKIIRD